MKRLWTRLLLPLLIVIAGAIATRGLISLRSVAARMPTEAAAPAVEVVTVASAELPATVVANGLVMPAREVTVMPQVSGRIVWVSPDLVPGGRFSQGQVLARIDARDYELMIRQEESRVRKAELELELEAGRQKIAKREWELLGQSSTGAAPDLALRKPHFAVAKWNLDAASSGLERAKLSLERTVLRAPFNSIVMSEKVDTGQLVGPSSQVAHLIGTDRARVEVSVPVERLNVIDVPAVNAKEGSQALVTHILGDGGRISRKGRVRTLIGALGAQTRTAQLLLEVDKPFASADQSPPLLPGAYVEAEITGKRLADTFGVPRAALHEGNRLWVVDNGRLFRRRIEVLWGNGTDVYVRGEIGAGDRVVVTPLSLPIAGMQVVVREAEAGEQP